MIYCLLCQRQEVFAIQFFHYVFAKMKWSCVEFLNEKFRLDLGYIFYLIMEKAFKMQPNKIFFFGNHQ